MKHTVFLFHFAVVLAVVQTKPIGSNDIPEMTQADKEEASQILFGERGILTGIFRMMDQQRKIQPNVQQDTADNGKIGNFDFKKVVDSLLMGAASKGELGDHGVELPEFLGICNRLSCGDIYKAIDKFRKSEMFSNFQTALTLVNDPNGWETIGKLLSNPELISQFTAGTGMEELFGSALGEVVKESNITKSKNSKLMPEDGDFGIDFSEDEENETVQTGKDKDNKVEFSVDMKGSESEDYYSEVTQNGDDSVEYETVVDETPPPSTKIVKSIETAFQTSKTSESPETITKPDQKIPEELPQISFSIDEMGEEKEFQTVVTENRPPPPRVLKRIHAGTNIGSTKFETVAATRSSGAKFLATPTPVHSKTTTTTRTIDVTTYPTVSATHRIKVTTTNRPTTTARNFRKDSDYYVMYYDDGDKL